MKRSGIALLAGLLMLPMFTYAQEKEPCQESFEMKDRPSEDKNMPKRSEMMDQLYGTEEAGRVFDRLQKLDPQLNLEIQRVAYDHFWARPGLSLEKKSYVTIMSLFALSKEEQTRIHLNGFLNSGGRVEQVKATLGLLVRMGLRESAAKGFAALYDVLVARGDISATPVHRFENEIDTWANFEMDLQDERYAKIVINTAKGQLESLRKELYDFLKEGGEVQEIKDTFMHQIVYCGFPAAMNGFAVLLNLEAVTQ